MTPAHHALDRPARPHAAKDGGPALGGAPMNEAQPGTDRGCNRVTAE